MGVTFHTLAGVCVFRRVFDGEERGNKMTRPHCENYRKTHHTPSHKGKGAGASRAPEHDSGMTSLTKATDFTIPLSGGFRFIL